jgi:hypothetical protein
MEIAKNLASTLTSVSDKVALIDVQIEHDFQKSLCIGKRKRVEIDKRACDTADKPGLGQTRHIVSQKRVNVSGSTIYLCNEWPLFKV